MSRLEPHACSRSILAALLLAAAALQAGAASSTSSAVSDAVSTSVGSLSTSVERSSNSSSRDDKVADGEYTVIEMAEAAARPGQVRLTLQGAQQTIFLYVPQETLRLGGLSTGQVVAARQRAFGVEFAAGEPRRAFFLALHDGWLPELQTRAVTL
ncbi:MAG: hypothetical protein Q8M01_13165 [Rubrivivax sp.]|nr:hypothetical protein [Rubrivivax sp.]